jgi:hypothetical protein
MQKLNIWSSVAAAAAQEVFPTQQPEVAAELVVL